MQKISTLGQKLWPTGREQTDTHTDTQTDRQTDRQRKQTLRTTIFEKFFFWIFFLKKERSNYWAILNIFYKEGNFIFIAFLLSCTGYELW